MIPLFRPHYSQEAMAAVERVMASGWTGKGPEVDAFEQEFSEALCNGRPVVSTNSCTSALFLALKCLDIGPGDEVIVPAITFASTAHVVRHVGARVVFADVDPTTVNASASSITSRMTDATAAVIVVHYGGNPMDTETLSTVCHDRGIAIVEDCAHAAGSKLHGRPVGLVGDAACYSFHAVKNISAGDGGAVSFQLPAMAERARRLSWLGIDKSTHERTRGNGYAWEYDISEPGFKMHMNDITAAICRHQLRSLPAQRSHYQHMADDYARFLTDDVPRVEEDGIEYPAYTAPTVADHSQSSWHLYPLNASRRDELSAYLGERGICTGVHYRPLTHYGCYRAEAQAYPCPMAELVWRRLLSLPMYWHMTWRRVEEITQHVRGFYNG